MEFKDLSFSTKVKLTAGLGLLWGGLILLLVQGPIHVVTIVMGNLMHLDGRLSRMEEIQEKANESNGQ